MSIPQVSLCTAGLPVCRKRKSTSSRVLPGLLVEPVERRAAPGCRANPHRGRRQVVALSSHHQGRENRRAVSPPTAPGRRQRRSLLAEGGRVLKLMRRRRRRGLLAALSLWRREHAVLVMVVQAGVGHGAVEAADGSDAHRERFGFVGTRVGRWRRRWRRAEIIRVGLVETTLLPALRSLRFLLRTCRDSTRPENSVQRHENGTSVNFVKVK